MPKHISYQFPKRFRWGVATSAAQIEGAPLADGKGESIWDRFTNVRGIDTPAVACDHYHRYKNDIALMSRLKIPNYRLSIAWPRILPDGRGKINEAGLDYYDRLIDALLKKEITPWVTLFHWDLPQALEDEGGWRVRSTVEAFSLYAEIVVRRFGDRVKHWITLNEMFCFIRVGYEFGDHAPGAKENRKVINQAYHHALLAHGHAVRAVRNEGRKGAKVGIVHLLRLPVPVTETNADIAAAQNDYMQQNGQIMEPLFRGRYPKFFLKAAGKDVPQISRGDLSLISQKTDFFGVNVYSGHFVRAGKNGKPEVVGVPKQFPAGNISWLQIIPQALYWAVRNAAELYGAKTMYITENGATFEDEVLATGEVQDLGRREYLRNYLIALHRAIQEKYDVRGFFLWSFLDNFEWAEGYSKRFGIVHVDYRTQKRTPKLSAHWYSSVIEQNRVV